MAKQTIKFEHNPGMMLVLTYFALLATNIMVLYLAQMWFPQYIVLGTLSLTAMWALCMSMAKLALINTFAIPFFTEWEHRRGKLLSSMDWMAGYFLVNFLGLWLITRYPVQYGLGVTSWMVIAVLALVLDLVQGMVMMKLEKWRKG
jgi:hypothetical protein